MLEVAYSSHQSECGYMNINLSGDGIISLAEPVEAIVSLSSRFVFYNCQVQPLCADEQLCCFASTRTEP